MKKETIPGMGQLQKLENILSKAKATFEEFSQACLDLASVSKKFQVFWRKLCIKAYEQGKKDGRRLRKDGGNE